MVARIGGQENAFTSNDYTGYFQRVPREQLKTVMEFEADRMTGLQLTDKVVLPERDVILEEQNQRVANNPRARLGEQIDAALYLNHPYGKPVIGWRHEMEQLSRDDAIGFYRRFYGPNGAVVVIAGDVEPEQARKLAEETYGKLKRSSIIAPRKRPQEPPPVAARSLTLADARVEQPMMQRAYLVPSFATAKPGQSEALEVLAHILGSGSNSRLYRALVVDKQVAVSAGASYDSSALDMSKFGVYGAPRQGITLPQFEAEADAVIAEVIDKGVTAEELERAKSRLIADAIFAQDNQASMARWYGAALMTGATVDDVRRWPDRIRAVTAEPGAGRRPPMARQAALGHRLPDQGCEPAGGEAFMTRLLATMALAALALLAGAPAASAMTIEKIVSPSGIEAWLVREQTVPLVTLNYAFHGGSSQDEADKSGTANLAADLLDEGAGDLDGKTFHERLENHAIELGFRVGRDEFPRLAARAQRAPRRGLRSVAAGADGAALRRRGGRAGARAGAVGAAPRHHQSQRSRQPQLVADRVSPAILTAAKARARWRRCRASPPTTCATMCAASSRATS